MHNRKEVSRQIYRMLIPMILENVLTTSASLVTTAMVGRLTALEISAQGVGGRITNTYLSLFKGLAIGVTVVAALYFGEGRRDKCRRTVEQAFATAVPLGLVITGLVAFFPSWFVKLFTSDGDIMFYAVGYLQILAVGLPFVAITCFVTAAFQSQGNTKTPMIIAGIVNAFTSSMGQIVNVGKNIVQGLWSGIQSLAGWIWDKVSGWISSIWDGICSFFGINSPSKEMAWVGEMLGRGLAGGIEDSAGEAVSAAEDLNNGILDVMNGLAADMQSAVPSNFAFDTAATVGSVAGGMGGAGGSSFGTLITIQQMIVRSEDDIRRISQELYNLIQTGSRAQGRFSTA